MLLAVGKEKIFISIELKIGEAEISSSFFSEVVVISFVCVPCCAKEAFGVLVSKSVCNPIDSNILFLEEGTNRLLCCPFFVKGS